MNGITSMLGVRFGLTLPNGKGILSPSDLFEPDLVVAFRKCPRCGQEKPLTEFGTRTRRGRKSALPYCRPCHTEYHTEWRHGKGRERFRASNKASKVRHPNRQRARDIAHAALKCGEIRWGRCVVGGDCSKGVEMHHDDYDKPLEVTWVCRKHHRSLDRARKTA